MEADGGRQEPAGASILPVIPARLVVPLSRSRPMPDPSLISGPVPPQTTLDDLGPSPLPVALADTSAEELLIDVFDD